MNARFSGIHSKGIARFSLATLMISILSEGSEDYLTSLADSASTRQT
jgi:hypothetical protein